jgi:hypothetical protein
MLGTPGVPPQLAYQSLGREGPSRKSLFAISNVVEFRLGHQVSSVKDFERTIESATAWLFLASVRFLTR